MRHPVASAFILILSALMTGCMGGGSGPSVEAGLTARFSYAPEAPRVGETVTFTDQSSGTIKARLWDFGDGQTAHSAEATHAYNTAGIYEVRLTLQSEGGATDQAVRFVQVGGGDTSSGLGVDFRYEVDQRTVDFEPIVTPSGVAVEQYFWEFGDGSTSKQPAPIHTYEAVGEYVVELRIATAQGLAKTVKKVAVGVVSSESTGLAGRSFAVIAIVDSGVNPYHEEFAAPEFQDHPSTYISGYPADALPLELSLDARSYTDAVRQDAETWSSVKTSKLYWIPGTRIIGAISVAPRGDTRILDDGADQGHGTATASDAAGASLGSCPTCLIVVVEGLGNAPLEWALRQPWIDVVSNSWSSENCLGVCSPASTNFAPPGINNPGATRTAVESGKAVLFASGNGALNAFESPQITYWNYLSGPDWVITVGAAEAGSGSTVVGTGRPVDVVSYGIGWKGAAHNSKDSIRGFGGTSAATPIVAGAYGYVLQKVRESFGDTHEGPHSKGVVAVGEKQKGALADGKVTRAEIERALFLNARGASSVSSLIFPPVLPDSAARFAYAGYGLVDARTAQDALAVVMGERAAPSRANEDMWASVDSSIRRSIWGPYDPGEDDVRLAPPQSDLWRSALLQTVLG